MTAWLLTWLWQGTALAACLSMVLRFLPRVNAATRYWLWWGAFAALVALGWQALPLAHFSDASVPAAMPGMSREAWPVIQVEPLPAAALSLIMMGWACVTCFRLLRIFPGLHALYWLKDECRPFPAELGAQLTLWRNGGRRSVRLALCDGLPGAAVLGFHDPCIAIPASLLAELRPDELDQIILHEYGHVQRRDDWMRLLQTVLEAAMWAHPASSLIGRALNLEREVACDDWVVARTGSAKNYARCLSRVAECGRAIAAPAFVQALFGGRRHLLSRVDRLLDGRRNTRRTPSLPAAVVGGLAIAFCAVQLRSFPLFSDVPVVSAQTVAPETAVSGFSRAEPPATVVSETVLSGVPPSRNALADRRSLGEGGSRTVSTSAVASSSSLTAPTATGVSGSSRTASTATVVSDSSRTVSTNGVADTVTPVGFEATPVLYPTRVFEGVYERADASLPARPEAKGPVDGVVSAGVGIGQAAQKAGLGLSNAFTRAGTGVARRF